jgi:hypothetical protein
MTTSGTWTRQGAVIVLDDPLASAGELTYETDGGAAAPRKPRNIHEVYRRVEQHVASRPPERRAALYEKYAGWLRGASKGAWGANKNVLSDGTIVFVAQDQPKAVVFDRRGGMYKGSMADRTQFPFVSGPDMFRVDFSKLRKIA